MEKKEMIELEAARQRLAESEKENRRLLRENRHLQTMLNQEKMASTAMLNRQKTITLAQRQRDRYLAKVLENYPSIVLFLTETLRIEFCTNFVIEKTGTPDQTDIRGRTLSEVFSRFLSQEAHGALLSSCKRVLETGQPESFDLSFRFHEAPEDFAGMLVSLKDAEAGSNGLMLMLHDITDLKKSRAEALAASEAKSAFLSNMSHEIRTPMNAIIGMTSIGKREKTLSRKDYALEKIENASAHLLGVINDILDISKIESGKMELSPILFDFGQMLDRVLNVITTKIEEKHQKLSVAIAPDIPKFLFGDDQRLAQVIANILSNAAKFTPEAGEITFHAALERMDAGQCTILLTVRDTGIGMTRQQTERLFNIFEQAEAGIARKYGGSGLGLAISRRILTLMGGDIWVESQPSEGSCFFFTAVLGIPDAEVTDARMQQRGFENGFDEHAQNFRGRRVLLVDDIEINLEILIAFLEPTGIAIDTATSGGQAYDMFCAQPERYDLILMDMQMPEVDGLQATRMIRAFDHPCAAKVPIIAMTANVFKEDVEQCLAAGMNDHLGKPIEVDTVFEMLNRYLR